MGSKARLLGVGPKGRVRVVEEERPVALEAYKRAGSWVAQMASRVAQVGFMIVPRLRVKAEIPYWP